MADKILVVFVGTEFVIGFGFTLWFVVEKVVIPAIDFIIEFIGSYEEFRNWRKRNGCE